MPCMVNSRMFSLYSSFLDMQSMHNLLTHKVLSYLHWWRNVSSGVFSFWGFFLQHVSNSLFFKFSNIYICFIENL